MIRERGGERRPRGIREGRRGLSAKDFSNQISTEAHIRSILIKIWIFSLLFC